MIVVLSGPLHSGKTNFLRRALARWQERGRQVSGYLSIAVSRNSGTEYDLLDLRDGRMRPFLTRKPLPGAERSGPFYFVPEALEQARAVIAAARPEELLVVDEVGPLELAGGGVWRTLEEVISRPGLRVLLVVREDILDEVVARLGQAGVMTLDIKDPNAEQLVESCLFGTQKLDDGQG